jgi:hypothetical protein
MGIKLKYAKWTKPKPTNSPISNQTKLNQEGAYGMWDHKQPW